MLLFFPLLTLASAEARKPLVYGISEKPFPLIASLDYPLCRAEAWLAALDLAAGQLPAALVKRLRNAGFDTRLARLALAALLCPLDVVTPEHVAGDRIRVFLKWPDDPLQSGLVLLDKTAILRMEMAFVWETRQTAARLRAIWPDSVAAGRANIAAMETLGACLNDLWQAIIFSSDELTGKQGLWASAFQENAGSAALAIASAAAVLPPGTASLNAALALLLEREAARGEDAPLWNWLSAKALVLRGRVHARRDSVALAQADFNTALARLKKTDADSQLAAQAWLNLGAIHRERNELAEMCAAFGEACALGECHSLSFARRDQLCLPDAK